MLSEKHQSSIDLIQQEYSTSSDPWIVGFSGGKDSSALLRLLYLALLETKHRDRPVRVIYCDTGVEIPVVRTFVRHTLSALSKEAKSHSLPLSTHICSPTLQNRYFVKVIGRGYPPPTNKFRWCTDKLRIDPVKRELDRHAQTNSVVLLGLRRGESLERDKTLSRYNTQNHHYFHQSGNDGALIFSPIIDFSVLDVWTLLRLDCYPKSLAGYRLEMLYHNSTGECPIIRDPKGTPCGKGRFGCWTCTVVRKDRSVTNLVRHGYPELSPLLDFRNWLAEIRDLPEYRCSHRRNGNRGLGPFTLRARRLILQRLLRAQDKSGFHLISKSELLAIRRLWQADKTSEKYRED